MSEQNALSKDDAAFVAGVAAVENSLGAALPEVDDQGNIIERPAQEESDPAEENKVILGMLITMLSPALPFLGQCYPPEVIERIAFAYSAVEQKYGWRARDLLGVEAQLAIVAIPPTVQAIVLGRAYFAAKKREADEQADKGSPRSADNDSVQ